MTDQTPLSAATRMRRSPKAEDYLALWLLRLAKMRRRAFTQAQGDEYDSFYEEFFDEKDLELYNRDRRMVGRREEILKFLEQNVAPHSRLLDVGCGLGDVLESLPPGYELHGTDYAQSNVRIARRRLGERADIQQANIYELPFESSSFDVCLCLEVLEHIEDDRRAVIEIARVLKPGGILIAAVPYTFYWPEYQGLIGHFRHYTRRSFTTLLEQGGLRTQVYLPNYPNWHQAYTRRYAMIRAQSTLMGRFFGSASLHEFRWPWQSEAALKAVERRLDPLRRRDMKLDYSRHATSTFVVVRKDAQELPAEAQQIQSQISDGAA